jgi:hypothetical protein
LRSCHQHGTCLEIKKVPQRHLPFIGQRNREVLTADQRDRLESIERRALRLISRSSDYGVQCVLFYIELIGVRLDNLALSFFRRICDPADCLNYLLPNERSSEVVCTLRQSNLSLLPGVICRTNRCFKSYLPYALNSYQF